MSPIETIKNWLWPKRTYEFDLIAPSTGERGSAIVTSRDELTARRSVIMQVDAGYWIIGLARIVEPPQDKPSTR